MFIHLEKGSKFLKAASTAVGALGAAAILIDSNAIGTRKANEEYKNMRAKKSVRQQISHSKMNYASPMYNELGNEVKDTFTKKITSAPAGIGGYFKGIYSGLKNNVGLLGFSSIALLADSKFFQKTGIIGAGAFALYGFLKNSTGLFQKDNYLD